MRGTLPSSASPSATHVTAPLRQQAAPQQALHPSADEYLAYPLPCCGRSS
jgi:hypothetical protein